MKKNIHTIHITNTKLVLNNRSDKELTCKRLQNLRVNTSNPNFNSPLMTKHNKTVKRKTLKEEIKNCEKIGLKVNETAINQSNIVTENNLLEDCEFNDKRTYLTKFLNIDELPSKEYSTFLMKTQELFPKLTNITFTQEYNRTPLKKQVTYI